MRRVKTYLRSSMTDNRLSDLALLNVHREIIITIDEVFSRFILTKRRFDL